MWYFARADLQIDSFQYFIPWIVVKWTRNHVPRIQNCSAKTDTEPIKKTSENWSDETDCHYRLNGDSGRMLIPMNKTHGTIMPKPVCFLYTLSSIWNKLFKTTVKCNICHMEFFIHSVMYTFCLWKWNNIVRVFLLIVL